MSTLIITRGLPASGKSTWAKEWVAALPPTRARVNRDDLRHALYGAHSGLNHSQEDTITTIETEAVRALLRSGKDVVVDAMHLRPKYVRAWQRVAHEHGAEFEIKEFEISPDESKQRNRLREIAGERFVPWQAIQGMTRRYLRKDSDTGRWGLQPYEPWAPEPKVEVEPYVADETKPWAIIVDLDGTLALHTSGRSPYDLSRVHEDSTSEPVAEMVHAVLMTYDVRVVYLSGREDVSREDTMKWIERHVGYAQDSYELHMRKAGDGRKDTIVKRELFDEHVRHNYNVQYVVDDRPSVCRMWRELGLFTFQVGDPHVEF